MRSECVRLQSMSISAGNGALSHKAHERVMTVIARLVRVIRVKEGYYKVTVIQVG